MKIKRVNELLNDPSMQDRECNFKLTTKKHEPPQWFKDFEEWINNLYLKSSGTEGTGSYNDTDTEIDHETEEVIYFSTYQKLYFAIYYNI